MNSPANTAPRRKAPLIIAGVLAFLLLLVLALPTLVASGPGQRWVLGMANERIAGTLTLESLALGWFSGQQLRGLQLQDADGAAVLQLAALDTDMTLLQAVRGKLNLGETRLAGLVVDLAIDEAGNNNLAAALAGPAAAEPTDAPLIIPVTGNMVLEDARVTLRTPDLAPIIIDQLQIAGRLNPDDRALDVRLKARTDYDGAHGNIDFSAQAEDWLDRRGALTPDTARFTVNGSITDFPLVAADRLLGQAGVLEAALGARLNAQLALSNGRFTTRVDSPLLAVSMTGTMEAGSLTLSEPGTARWQMTPALLRALGDGDDALVLAAAVPFTLSIAQLQLPLGDFDPAAVRLDAQLAAGSAMQLRIEDLGAIAVENFSARISTASLTDTVALDAQAAIRSERDSGQLAITARARELYNPARQLQPDQAVIDADIAVSALPTALVDRLSGGSGLLPALLGPQLALNGSISSGDAAAMTVRLSAESANLRTDTLALDVGDQIRLEQPASIRLRLTPAAFALLAPDSGYTLQGTVPVTVELTRFQAPRPAAGEPALQPRATTVALRLGSEAMVLRDAEGGEQRLSNLALSVAGDSLAQLSVDGGLRLAQGAEGMLTALSGAPLDVQLQVRTGLADDASIKATDANVSLASGALRGQLPLRLSAGLTELSLSAPASLTVPLTPALLTQWVAPETATLRRTTTLTADLQSLRLPLGEDGMAQLQVAGSAALTTLDLSAASGGNATVDDLKLNFGVDASRRESRLDADAKLSSEGGTAGSLTLRSVVSGPLAAPERLTADLSIRQLPLALLALVGDGALATVPGSPLDLTASANVTLGDAPKGSAKISADAARLKGSAELAIAEALTLSKPSAWEITLTPASFRALRADPENPAAAAAGMQLAQDVTLTLSAEALRWPLAADAGVASTRLRLQSPRIALLAAPGSEPLLLESLRGALDSSDLRREAQLSLDATTRDGASQPGTLKLSGRASNFLGDEGLDLDNIAWQLDGQFERLPVAFIDRLLDSDGLVYATLGSAAGMTLTSEVSDGRGPVQMNLTGSNAQMAIDAEWREGVITLRQPVTAQLQATAEFGHAVLGKAHPLFRSLQGGEQPIRLTIPVEGFALPVRDFALERITIPELRLEPGVMTLESGPLLDGLIALANRVGKGAGGTGTGTQRWRAEFTPAIMSLRDGDLAYTRRLDVLLGERWHLATWGTVDLQQARTDLVLSMMPHTLRTAFGIETRSEQGLRIPLQGGFDGSGVNYSAVAVELGRLQAERRGGTAGLLGALAGAVAAPRDTGTAPGPSVDPLPFAERITAAAAADTGAAAEAAEPATPDAASPAAAQPEAEQPPEVRPEDAVRGLLDAIRRRQ